MHSMRFRMIALLALLYPSLIASQQAGYMEQEENPTITLKECTHAGGCISSQAKVTLDANWRWIHHQSGYENCYTGNTWSSKHCSDPVNCARDCVLEGVTADKYKNTYGVEQINNGIKLNFVTEHEYGVNVGSRLYVMDGEDKYKLFYLKNREFTLDINVSGIECGINGAVYFSEMDEYGGKGLGQNNAGAKYGTGYCDAQCPHDIKFISGEANVIDWIPNPDDLSGNMGIGKYGTCCAEMDIWEANSMATAYTPHPCDLGETNAQLKCEGTACGDNDKGQRYDGVCDKDGCDINPYRMGNPNFYGRGPEYEVNTEEKMTVVTQFLTTDGTDEGDLSEIRRFYVQNGNIIGSPSSTILGPNNSDSITDDFCAAKKDLFGDVNDFQEKGGNVNMGKSLDRGQVLALSLWDDVAVNMLWLDSAYPLDKPATDPGVKRGDCPGGIGSTPTYLRANFPDSYVTFQNVAIGEIGSTLQVSPTPPPTPAPCGLCDHQTGTNQPECGGVNEEQCKRMNQYENKCQWIECPPSSPPNPPVATPTNAPITPATDTPVAAPVVTPTPSLKCKSSCYESTKPWDKLCKKKQCAGCPECATFPTNPPATVAPPTDAPVQPPASVDDYCCTWNYYNCGLDPFCNENSANCQVGCGGTWLSKSAPAMQCIAKFLDCTADESACCEGLTCEEYGTYKQCIDSSSSK